MSMMLSITLPCSGFGLNVRYGGKGNHCFESEEVMQKRNQKHGCNFLKMLLAAEICGCN